MALSERHGSYSPEPPSEPAYSINSCFPLKYLSISTISCPLASCKRSLRDISDSPQSFNWPSKVQQMTASLKATLSEELQRGHMHFSYLCINRKVATHRLRSGSGELYRPERPASSCGTSRDDFILVSKVNGQRSNNVEAMDRNGHLTFRLKHRTGGQAF